DAVEGPGDLVGGGPPGAAGGVQRGGDAGRGQHPDDAAVHREHLSGDAGGRGGGEVADQRGDVLCGERVGAVGGGRPEHAGGHAGAGAGADRVGGDAVPPQPLGGGGGERGDAALGRGVVGLAGGAEEERLGGGVDDPAVDRGAGRLGPGPPVRGGCPGGGEVAFEVDPQHGVPVLLGHVEQHPVPGDAGVVDQDVQSAVESGGGGHQPFGGGGVGGVADQGGGLPAGGADLGGDLVHLLAGVVEHQSGAVRGEGEGVCAAEAPGGPGDGGGPAVQAGGHGHRRSFLSGLVSRALPQQDAAGSPGGGGAAAPLQGAQVRGGLGGGHPAGPDGHAVPAAAPRQGGGELPEGARGGAEQPGEEVQPLLVVGDDLGGAGGEVVEAAFVRGQRVRGADVGDEGEGVEEGAERVAGVGPAAGLGERVQADVRGDPGQYVVAGEQVVAVLQVQADVAGGVA